MRPDGAFGSLLFTKWCGEGTVTEESEKRTKERAGKMTHSGETQAQNKCQDKGR